MSDMKRKTSKDILAESFRDIADNCGYSSATFYRQFKDKYDLIAWDYAGEIGRIMGDIREDGNWHNVQIKQTVTICLIQEARERSRAFC